MPLFGHNNPTTNQTQAGSLARTENDPMYNNERGQDQHAASGQLAGYMVPGVGLVTAQQAEQIQAINYEHKGHAGPFGTNHNSGAGMGTGHQSNAIPQGGISQGNSVPVQGDPMYDNQRGSVAQRGAEGAAVGGLAGHEGHGGHAGRDAAVLGAGGAAYEHEHNKHHHNAQAGNTGGVGAGGLSSGTNHHQIGSSAQPDLAEAKRLEKSAKMEKIVGTLTGNTAKKEDALEKKAEAAAIREQVRHVSNAEELEAQAQRARGVAVGMGAHPSVAAGRNQGHDTI